MNNTWYAIENFDKNQDFIGKNILALTPQACYELDKAGIKYYTAEDFYDENELTSRSDEYFFEQLQWFNEFDTFLKSDISVCAKENINLARAHYYQWVVFIDSIVIYSYILGQFLHKNNPAEIIYLYRDRKKQPNYSIYSHPQESQALIRSIIIRLCQRHDIKMHLMPTANNEETKSSLSKYGSIAVLIKIFFIKLRLKSFYFYFKYRKFNRIFHRRRHKDINILFLHLGGYFMDYIVKESVNQLGKLFFKTNDSIYLLSGTIQKSYLKFGNQKHSAYAVFREECKRASANLDSQEKLFEWVNEKCGIDVKDVILHYFKDFIENICAQDLYERQIISEFLKKEKVSYVISLASSQREAISGFLAASRAGVKRACFQHGCSPLYWRPLHIIELDLTDIYFTADKESANYCKECLRLPYLQKCQIAESFHYLNTIPKAKLNGDADNVIIYVPHRVFFGFRCFVNFHYHITWHYRLQKAIVDFFGKNKDYKLIFKPGQNQDWIEESIVQYIKFKGYQNVVIDREIFRKCHNKAGRALFDYPSSSLYEAAVAGLPVMGLCSNLFKEWQPATKIFGKSIQKFSTIADAVEKIDNFIKDNPQDYKVSLPLSEKDFVEYFIMAKN